MLTTLLKNVKNEDPHLFIDPVLVHVDFESAVITANYHTCSRTRCTYSGLFLPFNSILLSESVRVRHNREKIKTSLNCLAFLPVGDVKDGMAYLKNIVPEEAEMLLNYFDSSIQHIR